MNTKYQFKRTDWKFDKLLICPTCLETLFRHDIEHFAKCPYCDRKIEFNSDVEDFILKPVIDRWLDYQKIENKESVKFEL